MKIPSSKLESCRLTLRVAAEKKADDHRDQVDGEIVDFVIERPVKGPVLSGRRLGGKRDSDGRRRTMW